MADPVRARPLAPPDAPAPLIEFQPTPGHSARRTMISLGVIAAVLAVIVILDRAFG
jgi:hypothetical protein